MSEWVLVDSQAMIRHADVSVLSIEPHLDGLKFCVVYKGPDGSVLHRSRPVEDKEEAQHLLAEFVLQATTDSTPVATSDAWKNNWTIYTSPRED